MYSKCIKTLNFTPCHKLQASIELKKSYMEQFILFNYGVGIFSFEVKKGNLSPSGDYLRSRMFPFWKISKTVLPRNLPFQPKINFDGKLFF